jgi:ubiquitin-conjugating enzyme E2 Q
VNPELVENVYQWIVELHSFDESHPLSKDMKKKDVRSIVLELRFGKQFPYTPPFVRVIRPRFLPFMLGGGGHVTAGGALCMELLTNSGWNPAGSIEGVLLQVRMAITEMDPPARLEDGPVSDYGIGEAMEAFRRACITHGWEIPADFNTINSKPMRLGAGI